MSLLTAILRRFRFVRRLERKIEALQKEAAESELAFPVGHYYSPLPSRDEVADVFARGQFGPPFAAIDLNEAGQVALLEKFAGFYPEQPFPEKLTSPWRYYLDNPSYGAFDGIILWSMLRHVEPRRIIEVGSGFSSAAMLDLNERVFGGRFALTFIDPDMGRLRALLREDDVTRVTLVEKRVQDVPLDVFRTLAAGDILFIDSSHVSKVGSDVNRLFFDILPALEKGVWIHIHDVAGNFEYPREWFEEGRAWNEQYLLRAFLMYNSAFEIALSSGWLFNARQDIIRERMPLCARGGGGQLWLRKT